MKVYLRNGARAVYFGALSICPCGEQKFIYAILNFERAYGRPLWLKLPRKAGAWRWVSPGRS